MPDTRVIAKVGSKEVHSCVLVNFPGNKEEAITYVRTVIWPNMFFNYTPTWEVETVGEEKPKKWKSVSVVGIYNAIDFLNGRNLSPENVKLFPVGSLIYIFYFE